MPKSLFRVFSSLVVGAGMAVPVMLQAQASAPAAPPTAEEIAKKLANPIASMVSLPFQANLDVGIGPDNGSKLQLNIQPVIPFSLGPKVNLITRWIVPVISQFDVAGANTSQAGLGDATISAFFGPSSGKVTWGVGPAFIVPIATDDQLGGKKTAVGPSVIALRQSKGWTVGALANHLVSVAGDTARSDISATFLNPFAGYNWKSGAGMLLNVEYTHDWENDVNVLVVHPQFSGVTKYGGQSVQFVVAPRLHFAPDGHASFGVRSMMIFVFPK